MHITTLPLGPLGANCYIVSAGACCAVIDPGDNGPATTHCGGSPFRPFC